MELFEDDRFLIDLNDAQKGLYLMLLGLAGKTNNAIRNDIGFIKGRLNLKELKESDIERISKVYTKFKLIDNYWTFENFAEAHNYVIGNTKGNPAEFQRSYKKENKKENKKKNKTEHCASRPTLDQAISYFTELKKPQEAAKFFNHFESNGWVVGKAKATMRNWMAAARGWVERSDDFTSPQTSNGRRRTNLQGDPSA